LKSIAKHNLTQADYDFLANKVLINNQPSYLYIRQQLISLQPDVLAGIVKENIVEMVRKEIW